VGLDGVLRQYHVQHPVQLQQQMRHPGAGKPAAEFSAGAARHRPQRDGHAHGQVKLHVGELRLGGPRIDPAVEQLAQQLAAAPVAGREPAGATDA